MASIIIKLEFGHIILLYMYLYEQSLLLSILMGCLFQKYFK